jgi:hypothetical protein
MLLLLLLKYCTFAFPSGTAQRKQINHPATVSVAQNLPKSLLEVSHHLKSHPGLDVTPKLLPMIPSHIYPNKRHSITQANK